MKQSAKQFALKHILHIIHPDNKRFKEAMFEDEVSTYNRLMLICYLSRHSNPSTLAYTNVMLDIKNYLLFHFPQYNVQDSKYELEDLIELSPMPKSFIKQQKSK